MIANTILWNQGDSLVPQGACFPPVEAGEMRVGWAASSDPWRISRMIPDVNPVFCAILFGSRARECIRDAEIQPERDANSVKSLRPG